MYKRMSPREEIEERAEDCGSKRGMLNRWVCSACGNTIVGVHLDSGVTPFVMRCPKCGGDAHSRFYRVPQPDVVWFRPDSLHTLIAHTKQEHAKLPPTLRQRVKLDNCINESINHYNGGGLFMRWLKNA